MSPFWVAFNFWLLPAETPFGFSPVLMTYSLYSFLAHEVITHALANRPLLLCTACGDFLRTVRRDSKFCSGRCRTSYFRSINGKRSRVRIAFRLACIRNASLGWVQAGYRRT